MEFEMTVPMLDFIVRLHRHGESPYDEVSRADDIAASTFHIKKMPVTYLLLKICVLLYVVVAPAHLRSYNRAVRSGMRATESRRTSTCLWTSRYARLISPAL